MTQLNALEKFFWLTVTLRSLSPETLNLIAVAHRVVTTPCPDMAKDYCHLCAFVAFCGI